MVELFIEGKTRLMDLVRVLVQVSHDSCNTKGATVLGSQVQSPWEVNVLLNIFYTSLRSNTKLSDLPILCNFGKTRLELFVLNSVLSDLAIGFFFLNPILSDLACSCTT